jgi:hypothetical protein
MRDKIQQTTSFRTNTYQFYSITNFNLTLNPIYGKLDTTILTPEGKTITKTNIELSTEVAVSNRQSESKSIDYFDSSSRFIINVSSNSDASYFISVKKEGSTVKLYQGMPITLSIGNETTGMGGQVKVQFSNI